MASATLPKTLFLHRNAGHRPTPKMLAALEMLSYLVGAGACSTRGTGTSKRLRLDITSRKESPFAQSSMSVRVAKRRRSYDLTPLTPKNVAKPTRRLAQGHTLDPRQDPAL
eukprot:391375-Amphidinium_carterae.1